jgi:hypothetical protein
MPLSILQQAIKRSAELMETNNSVSSRVSDQLYSILETGEWSTEIRDLLDQVLHNFASTNLMNPNPQYTWDALRKYSSIKEKIAYLTACYHENMTAAWLTADSIINDTSLRSDLDQVIQFLECKLISNRDFTESWILRHAAFNRFAPGLTAKESSSINTIASELKKLCEDNNFENLAQSTHFTKESDPQKIMKLGQVAKELSWHGLKIPDSILWKLEPLDQKIEPLKKLDVDYKHMINMLNMIHSLPKWYPSMIGQEPQRKLRSMLEKLGKKESDFFIKPRETTKTNEYNTLEDFYRWLVSHQDFGKILEEFWVTENEFQKWFLVYFTYRNSEIAKENLDSQKKRTFGNKEKDYEQDIQQQRGKLKNRIFEIGQRMNPVWWGSRSRDHLWGGERFEFRDDQDYELANSYFSKFQNLFFVNERDAYSDHRDNRNMRNARNRTTWVTPIENHYLTMRNTIAAILRKRMPALCTGSHDRHGSAARKMYKWLEWFFKWQEEKGFWKMIKRSWHNADHAEIMAMMIMLNNQQQQKMFHSPKSPFKHNDWFFGKIFKWLHLTERYRQNLGKKIAPAANKFLKIVEFSGKTVVGKPLVAGAEAYNKALKTYKRYKTPFYALLPVTWIVAKWKDAYHGTQKYLSELKGEQVNQISSALVDATDAVTGMVGNTFSYAWWLSYDKYKTNQQRGVLSTFFELACEDDKRRELVQSSELSEIFNFQNRETYLFDEDGRVDMVEAKEETKQMKAGKELSKKMKEQIEQLQKGINDFEEILMKKLENSNNKDEQEKLLDRQSQLETRKWDITNIQIEIEKLIPILKDPAGKTKEIEAIIWKTTGDWLKKIIHDLQVDNKDKIDLINDRETVWLDTWTTPNNNKKSDQEWIIRDAEWKIEKITDDDTNYEKDKHWNKKWLNTWAKTAISQQENRKKRAEQKIFELNNEIIQINAREWWLKRVLSICNTLIDTTGTTHLDEETLKSLTNGLNLLLYKPSIIPQTTQQTANNLAWALAA